MRKAVIPALAALMAAGAAQAADKLPATQRHVVGPYTVEQAKALGVTLPSAANEHAIHGYPFISRANGEEGNVVLAFIVETDGTVSHVHVIASSNYPRLDEASIEDVRKNWRYHPAEKNGKPFPIWQEAVVSWHLRHSQKHDMTVFVMKPADFPPGAREKGESGKTVLGVRMNANGIGQIILGESSGYNDLDDKAREIVRGWHITPAAVNGRPVTTFITAAFIWQTEEAEQKAANAEEKSSPEPKTGGDKAK